MFLLVSVLNDRVPVPKREFFLVYTVCDGMFIVVFLSTYGYIFRRIYVIHRVDARLRRRFIKTNSMDTLKSRAIVSDGQYVRTNKGGGQKEGEGRGSGVGEGVESGKEGGVGEEERRTGRNLLSGSEFLKSDGGLLQMSGRSLSPG